MLNTIVVAAPLFLLIAVIDKLEVLVSFPEYFTLLPKAESVSQLAPFIVAVICTVESRLLFELRASGSLQAQ